MAICQKLQKIWHFQAFLTQDHMQLEFSIFNFSHIFHWSQSKLCDNIGYHGKSECLLEYCNDKLASSTGANNFILFTTFQNILVYWVFSSSRASRPLGLLLTLFFRNSNFKFVAYEEIKIPSDRRAKRSEIWDSRVVVPHIWGTFGLVTFKVMSRW